MRERNSLFALFARSASSLASSSAFSIFARSVTSCATAKSVLALSDQDEEMARVAALIANDATGASGPDYLAIFAQVALLNAIVHSAFQHRLANVTANRDLVGISDVERSAAAEFVLGIIHHLAKLGVSLQKLFIQSHDRHSNWRFLKDLT